MRRAASFILFWGAVISGALIMGGAALHFMRGEPAMAPRQVPINVWRELPSGNPEAIIELGIMTLLLTPLMALFVIGLQLLRLRDWGIGGVAMVILLIVVSSYLLH